MFQCIKEWREPGSSYGKPADLSVKLPSNRAEVKEYFGCPELLGIRKFKRGHMTIAKNLPGEWNNGRGRLYVNKKAEQHLRDALELAESRGVLKEIYRLGCYVHRHQRHDPERPLSYHSYGIAIDINPLDNRAARGKITPFSNDWKKQWPNGLSRTLVDCFKQAGWSWGGDWRAFIDPMHFELLRWRTNEI